MSVQGVQGSVQGSDSPKQLKTKACAGCAGCAGYIRARAHDLCHQKRENKLTRVYSTPHTLHTLHISVLARVLGVQGAFYYLAHPTHHQKSKNKEFCWNGEKAVRPITLRQKKATKSAKPLMPPASSTVPGRRVNKKTSRTTLATTRHPEIIPQQPERHDCKRVKHAKTTALGCADV